MMIILYVVLSFVLLIVGVCFLLLVGKSKKQTKTNQKKKDSFRTPVDKELN